ncbi:MAG: M1 family metallopeptidase [Bacteroidetes bacterium]|nr:M1 family metallopeptidase [Bacteroidota bacterium]
MKLYLLIICVLFKFTSIVAQDDSSCWYKSQYLHSTQPSYFSTLSANGNFDVKQYILKVNINPDTLFISGQVTTIFKSNTAALQQLYFNLSSALIVDSIYYHQNNILYTHSSDIILASLPQSISNNTLDSITIYYHGSPSGTGGFSSFGKGSHSSGNAIWTLSQPYGASDWWPCKNTLDDKADSLDIYITTPKQFQAAANGLLVDSFIKDTFMTFHWKHRKPIATYLIAVAVSKYEIYTNYIYFTPQDSMPMLNYVYPSSATNARIQTAVLAKSIGLFSQLFGTYPFKEEKYGHAQFGWGGGMEHQTMSFVGNFSQDLLIHELAHQWFGDKVTCGSWSDLWLNEGFATYLTGLSKEYINTNKNDFIDWKASSIDRITMQSGGTVYTNDTLSVNRLFDNRLTYTKASMVLHMLRKIVGDTAFYKACNAYLSAHAYNFGYTFNLIEEMEKASGKSLKYFFSQWFYGEGYPIYNIYWKNKANNTVDIDIYQRASVSTIDFFNLPVTIRFTHGSTFKDIVLDHQYNGQHFEITLPFEADSAVFNPEYDMISLGNIEQKGTIKSDGKSHLIFYPINGDNQLQFEVTNGLTIKSYDLFDENGKLISSYAGPQPLAYGSMTIDHLSPSFYFIRCVLSDGNMESVKIPVLYMR